MAWNKPVTEARYEEIKTAIQKSGLKFDGRKTWDNNWKSVTADVWKKLSEIPEFNSEITKKISGLSSIPGFVSTACADGVKCEGEDYCSIDPGAKNVVMFGGQRGGKSNLYTTPLSRMIIEQGIKDMCQYTTGWEFARPGYNPKPTSSPQSLMSSLKTFIKDKLRSPEDKALFKAGVIDECGNLTCSGEDALKALLLDKHKKELAVQAQEMIDEQVKSKKA